MKQGRLSSLERDTRKPRFEEIERIALFLGRTPNCMSVLHRAAVRQLAGAH